MPHLARDGELPHVYPHITVPHRAAEPGQGAVCTEIQPGSVRLHGQPGRRVLVSDASSATVRSGVPCASFPSPPCILHPLSPTLHPPSSVIHHPYTFRRSMIATTSLPYAFLDGKATEVDRSGRLVTGMALSLPILQNHWKHSGIFCWAR